MRPCVAVRALAGRLRGARWALGDCAEPQLGPSKRASRGEKRDSALSQCDSAQEDESEGREAPRRDRKPDDLIEEELY